MSSLPGLSMPESQRAQRIGIVIPSPSSGNTGTSDAVSPVSRHAKQPCPLHCSHVIPGTGIFSKAHWHPGLHLGMEAQAGDLRSPQICLRIMPMLGCRAGLLFRGPGVSALLCPPFVRQIVEAGQELLVISGFRFCTNHHALSPSGLSL